MRQTANSFSHRRERISFKMEPFLTMLSGKYSGTYFNQTNYSVLNNAKQEIYWNIYSNQIYYSRCKTYKILKWSCTTDREVSFSMVDHSIID